MMKRKTQQKVKILVILSYFRHSRPLESPFRVPKGPPSLATLILMFQYQISFKLDQSHIFFLIPLPLCEYVYVDVYVDVRWPRRLGFWPQGWDFGLKAGFLASRLGFEPQAWNLNLKAGNLGLKAGIWASRLGFKPQCWDWSFKAGIWASRLRFGQNLAKFGRIWQNLVHKIRIWASRLGFGLQDWVLVLKAGIWALRPGF